MTYIIIEGVIGVGKTALTRSLGERFGVPTFFEQFEANPFLSGFYADREQYAFQTEVFFLLNRYRQQQSAVKPALHKGDIVADYLFAKTRLFAGLNLRDAELDLFDQIYDALSSQVAAPTLVVYLRAPVDVLMSRIYQRDRSFERGIQREYITDLARLYDAFFDEYRGSPLLTVDTGDMDFVRNSHDREGLINRVMEAASNGHPGALHHSE